MEPSFRKSMAWLHTWTGLVLGSLLYVVLWMGTLSVFDREIDRWMMPGTRLAPAFAQQPVSLDGPITQTAQRLAQGAPEWSIRLPSERVPAVELRWRDNGSTAMERRYLHPQTGAVLEHTHTLAGTGFIFPFHYSLHLKWKDVGIWLVGLGGMAMLVLVVSGVLIHRRLVADFFLFRPRKQLQRASLDLHNLTGVLALPFHFVSALSGLVILFTIYWPSSYLMAYPQAGDARQAFGAEGLGQYRRARANNPGHHSASLDDMLAHAQRQWHGGRADFVRVWHPGDSNSHVEVRRTSADMLAMNLDQLYFDASSGIVLHAFEAAPIMASQRFLTGLHRAQWDHWWLRWLYFGAGLMGCVMTATGLLFWLESRRSSHARKGLAGVQLVEALAVFSVPGVLIATLVFFVANRLLPQDAALAGQGRAGLETGAFYIAWICTLIHAAVRARAAWRDQARAIGGLALLAVLLNWATTGHHLAFTISHARWAVAGMDLILLAAAVIAIVVSRRLRRQESNAAGRPGMAQPERSTSHA